MFYLESYQKHCNILLYLRHGYMNSKAVFRTVCYVYFLLFVLRSLPQIQHLIVNNLIQYITRVCRTTPDLLHCYS